MSIERIIIYGMFFVVFGFMVIGIKSCSDFIVLVFKMFVYICEVDFMFVSLFSYNDMYVYIESILVILYCIKE